MVMNSKFFSCAMKPQRLTSVLAILALTMTILGAESKQAKIAQAQTDGPQTTQFVCTSSDGVPATVARTPGGDVPVILWKYTGFRGYTPQQRCLEVSNRFQRFYDNGTLKFMATGRMNRENVVCVTERESAPCSGLLFTLRPRVNPNDTLKELLAVRNNAGGYLNETGDRIYINMEEYLREGIALATGTSNKQDTNLNPNPEVNPQPTSVPTPPPLW